MHEGIRVGRRSAGPAMAWSLAALIAAGCGGGGSATSSASPAVGSPDPGASAPVPGGLDEAQAVLASLLRADARVGCAPAADELPNKARAAISCAVGSALVERVRVIGFDGGRDAAQAYLRLLRDEGVRPRSGTCERGKGGDGAWAPGDDPRDVTEEDGVRFDGELFIPQRYGCFVADGVARALATCSGSLVEVVSTAADLTPLHDWVWAYSDETDLPDPTPPGICEGSFRPSS